MGHCAAARGQHPSVLSTVQTQDQHIKTSLCLGDYNAGNWLQIFHHPVKAKLAVMLNPRWKILHLCHSNCTCMLIPICMLFWTWPGLGWSCTWRKEPPYVITKEFAPSTILAAGWILELSDLWDSAQSFAAKTGQGWAQKRLFSVDLAILVKSFKEGHMICADGQSNGQSCDLLSDWKKKNYLMHCRYSSPALIFNRNVPL